MPFLYISHPFLYHVSVHQVPATTEILSKDFCMYVVMHCSLAKSGTHLHWQKLGVALHDVNLSKGETIYWL